MQLRLLAPIHNWLEHTDISLPVHADFRWGRPNPNQSYVWVDRSSSNLASPIITDCCRHHCHHHRDDQTGKGASSIEKYMNHNSGVLWGDRMIFGFLALLKGQFPRSRFSLLRLLLLRLYIPSANIERIRVPDCQNVYVCLGWLVLSFFVSFLPNSMT